jgi:DNA-binding MarR family transcriptional regulator
MTELILQTFRFHGALMDSAERLVRPIGLTAARWQVISSVARAAQLGPVAHIARDMGLSRQSVQRLADVLVGEGLVEYRNNPHHKRAPLVALTDRGREAFEAVTRKQVTWVNSLAAGAKPDEIEHALTLLQELEQRLRAT